MSQLLSIVLAVLAAVSNAFGTVFQRRAALEVPQSRGLRLSLMWDLIRTPVWLLGIVAVIASAILQAAALATGLLALVQPIFALELPCALLISGIMFRRPLNRVGWISVTCVVIGLGTALFAASPSGGTSQAPFDLWVLALACCGGTVIVLCALALRMPVGRRRAAFLGLATAISYSLTAALMKSATDTLSTSGAGAFFTAWQTYAFAGAGASGLFLLENAMQAGPLIASQPALTLGDGLISLSLGVVLYDESVRTGWWLVPAIGGVGLVAAGVSGLSRLEVLAPAAAGAPGIPNAAEAPATPRAAVPRPRKHRDGSRFIILSRRHGHGRPPSSGGLPAGIRGLPTETDLAARAAGRSWFSSATGSRRGPHAGGRKRNTTPV